MSYDRGKLRATFISLVCNVNLSERSGKIANINFSAGPIDVEGIVYVQSSDRYLLVSSDSYPEAAAISDVKPHPSKNPKRKLCF